jgi:hypothetical protein
MIAQVEGDEWFAPLLLMGFQESAHGIADWLDRTDRSPEHERIIDRASELECASRTSHVPHVTASELVGLHDICY